jgi:Short-chain dehydrogenases of various substrate specificities
MKTALVTGASSGIGEAAVQRLLHEGYHVYAGARRLERMAGLKAAGAKILSLDLTDDASIVAAVEAIRADSGRLDALINNAGYGAYGALEEVALGEARRQMEVNLFGQARLIQLVLPLMRRQQSGRIVNVTSVGGKFGEPFGSWYHASKFALEGLSDCLRMELAPLGIKVIVIEPGAIKTEWGGIAGQSLLAASGTGPYAEWAVPHGKVLASADALADFASPPEAVAKTIARALKSRRPRTRYATGGRAKTFMALNWLLSDRIKDRLARRAFDGYIKKLKA